MGSVNAKLDFISFDEYPKIVMEKRCENSEGPHKLYQRCVFNAGHEGNCLILGLPKPLTLPRKSDIKKAQILSGFRKTA